MPKPVLSDSLFNADDVATAILSEANLSIANSLLGVTDRSSLFNTQSGWTTHNLNVYSFNGFMFFMAEFQHNGGLPTSHENIWVINDSNYYPIENSYMPTISYEGDTASTIYFKTDGDIQILYPVEGGSNTNWYGIINGWYRFT